MELDFEKTRRNSKYRANWYIVLFAYVDILD